MHYRLTDSGGGAHGHICRTYVLTHSLNFWIWRSELPSVVGSVVRKEHRNSIWDRVPSCLPRFSWQFQVFEVFSKYRYGSGIWRLQTWGGGRDTSATNGVPFLLSSPPFTFYRCFHSWFTNNIFLACGTKLQLQWLIFATCLSTDGIAYCLFPWKDAGQAELLGRCSE
jgi:hypothetical protein